MLCSRRGLFALARGRVVRRSLNTVPDEMVNLGHELCDLSGAVVMKYFRRRKINNVDIKPDSSPVTIADREAEVVMRERIMDSFPSHVVFGEEGGRSGRHESELQQRLPEWMWVLDPIDGTRSFMIGSPIFGTLISLTHFGKPVMGFINQPIIRERWYGAMGFRSHYNGVPIRVHETQSLRNARISTSSPVVHRETDRGVKALQHVLQSAGPDDVYHGGDCYVYGLLSCGYVDVVIDPHLKPWDFCALDPIISGAGGHICDWEGRALNYESDGKVLATASRALELEVLKIISGYAGDKEKAS